MAGSARDITAIQAAVVRCRRCPELRAYTACIAREKKREYRDCEYWGKPVPGFGDPDARLVLVGLAPGAHGSNRTGRPFTGDASGDFLYPALYRAAFASAPVARDRNDGLVLRDCFITAAARCAPPQNKPTPQELRNCFSFLVEEFEALERLRVAIGLGAIGFNASLRALARQGFAFAAKPVFAHGAKFDAVRDRRTVTLLATYHPSRQNTNTGKLTVPMFDAIFTRAKEILAHDEGAGPQSADPAPGLAHPSSNREPLDSLEKR
jgi:uracil-DNA glycosylase family 4